MSKDRIGEDMGKPTVTIGARTEEIGEVGGKNTNFVGVRTDGIGECSRAPHNQVNKKCFSLEDQNEKQPLEEHEQQLLPGIRNEITSGEIAPKLPWKTFHVLSAVSRGWRKSNQSRQVYNTRVHSSTTETHIVHSHDHHRNNARIAIFSMIDKDCYECAPIPGVYRGVSCNCQCISLNGKIYVLGGEIVTHGRSVTSKEVYVLDVAGQRQWQRCADMQEKRHSFGCGVIDGKIYVFGGVHDGLDNSYVEGSEVYDPELNAWSSIMPMGALRSRHSVSTLGDKLIVHDGWCNIRSFEEFIANVDDVRWNAKFAEVYDPVTDVWTVVGPCLQGWGILFVAQGKLHWIDHHSICVHDADDDSWEDLHSNSFPAFFRGNGSDDVAPFELFELRAVVVVDDELFLRVVWNRVERDSLNSGPSISGSALLHSKGFGSENTEISWQFLSNCPSSYYDSVMCTIQL